MVERDAKQLFTLDIPNSSGTPLCKRTYLLNILNFLIFDIFFEEKILFCLILRVFEVVT